MSKKFHSPKSADRVDFTDVIFDWDGRAPREPVDEIEDLNNNNKHINVFTPTYRKLAGILGQCNVYPRHQNTFNIPGYRDIAKLAFPPSSKSWDDQVEISDINLQILRNIYIDCRKDINRCHVEHPSTIIEINSFAILATDASYNKSTQIACMHWEI